VYAYCRMSFPITCTACHKTFTISDEIYEKKVAGRVVTIKCKSCSQGIRVDGTKGGGAAAAAAPAPAVAAPAAAEPTLAGDPLWAVDYPDGQDREFTTAEVVAELERGVVSGTTLVWRDGMAEWLELYQVPELAPELAKIDERKKAAAVAAAKAAAAAAGPVHKPRARMPTVTGIGGLPGIALAARPKPVQPSTPDVVTPRTAQASSPELAKPRVQQPSSPWLSPELAKPRVQQPSSPGLSPGLPKPRPQQPSSPELPRPRAQQPSSPGLPKPPPAPPPLAAPAPPPAPTPPLPFAAPPPAPTPPLPFATPPPPLPMPDAMPEVTPPLPASVAKVVSRPPQVPPTFPMTAAPVSSFGNAPALVSDHASVEWPEAKKKTPLIIGGLIAAVVVIGGGIFALSGKEEEPPAAPISALPPGPAATLNPSPTPTPTPTSTPAPAAPQPGAETATGSDPVPAAPDPGATPGAGFAELFAAGARKAESKGATIARTERFDPAVTKAPLAQAANDAQACKQGGGPTGKVTVVVTFDPSGKVSGATITEAPFAGTATGACISSALKRAAIAPFSGLPGSVSKTFSIL
jgi:GYF domain 2